MKLSLKLIMGEILVLVFLIGTFFLTPNAYRSRPASATASPANEEASFIKWVDFDVTAEAMRQALRYDVDTYQAELHFNWIELLAWLGTKYGGDFSKYKEKDLDQLIEKLQSGTTMAELTQDSKYYSYYLEAYEAVLGGMVGTYEIQIPASEMPGYVPPAVTSESVTSEAASDSPATSGIDSEETIWVTKYGLKSFLPIAKGFPYQDFDDFGVARSYGFRRQHLGHDLMGQVGTPVIAIESGYVEAIGWNQYGGWRLGIRSFDKKRYYYYAHLRKNYPYFKTLEEGSVVQAGDVIGYLGRTGYSRTENTNNIDDPHLHFGIQLIFDESQKEGNNEIWINCYEITKFLTMNRTATVKNPDTKEYYRLYQIKDPAVPSGAKEQNMNNPEPVSPASD